ncbi:MAG: glycosyltransferase [Labilithrix sp.]|nr:glycosyltransferase [Labilithrix sp.]
MVSSPRSATRETIEEPPRGLLARLRGAGATQATIDATIVSRLRVRIRRVSSRSDWITVTCRNARVELGGRVPLADAEGVLRVARATPGVRELVDLMERDPTPLATALRRGRPRVSVVVPTFERLESLSRLLDSLDAQIEALPFEIVVVDNSTNGSARDLVERRASRHPLRYVHEPAPGVSAARNRGVAVARADLIAFIDDDEEADEDWLAHLVRCQDLHHADAVFGWVEAVLEDGAGEHGELFAAAIERRFACASGDVPRALVAKLGTGNSLFHRRVLGDAPFDDVFGASGGEDSALIRRIASEGGRLAWCREARVVEHVPTSRTSMLSILERRFSSGQLRTRQHLIGRNRRSRTAALIVVAGALQTLVALPLAVVGAPLARPFAARMLAQAAGGAGKVLFMEPFFVCRYRRPKSEEAAQPSAEPGDFAA